MKSEPGARGVRRWRLRREWRRLRSPLRSPSQPKGRLSSTRCVSAAIDACLDLAIPRPLRRHRVFVRLSNALKDSGLARRDVAGHIARRALPTLFPGPTLPGIDARLNSWMPECKRRLDEELRTGGEGEGGERTGCFDVFAPNGRLFGFCTSTVEGQFVFIQPERLRGASVMAPMRVGTHLNSLSVAVFLTSAVCLELNR